MLAVSVTVELIGVPVKLSVVGLITQVRAAAGAVDVQLRPTVPVSPPNGVTVIWNRGPCCPEEIVWEFGVTASLKSPT